MNEAPEWFKEHIAKDAVEFADRPTKAEMRTIVHDALVDFFESKGSLAKNFIVTLAVVIGSVAVIGGGLKWLIGLAGFSYLGK